MPFREFQKNDLFYNRVKAFPKSQFVIHRSNVYYNDFKSHTSINPDQEDGGVLSIHGTKQGFISLYELNVNRKIDKGSSAPPNGKSIYPFITKEGTRIAFKTVSTSEFDTTSQFTYGDVIKGDYPLTSSIKRIYFQNTSVPFVSINNDERFHGSHLKLTSNKRYINSLRNTFNEYINSSHHFSFNDSDNPSAQSTEDEGIRGWDKSVQESSLIEIPSIFYGSSIKKGSVVLQMFYTGSLIAECRDTKKDGELIQVSGTMSGKKNGKVAGVVLYNEGFLHMTGSWNLGSTTSTGVLVRDDYNLQNSVIPRWIDFGASNRDSMPGSDPGNSPSKTSFILKFEGINYVPTITMFAHAPKGEVNNSTNPTVYVKSQVRDPESTGTIYREFQDLEFTKLEHSDYQTTGSYSKETYISKIGIYDDQKRLIGVAKLANPVRKTEDREYTFKLKMDF
tara:strand:+ start:1945 stop:3291 length:1347 start_codon:yes stop_codon:yes gene_type:complete